MTVVPMRLNSTYALSTHAIARSSTLKASRSAGRAGATIAMSSAPMSTPTKSRPRTARSLLGFFGSDIVAANVCAYAACATAHRFGTGRYEATHAGRPARGFDAGARMYGDERVLWPDGRRRIDSHDSSRPRPRHQLPRYRRHVWAVHERSPGREGHQRPP